MPLLSSSTKRNNLSPAFNTTRLGRALAAIVRQRVPPMFHVTSKQARCQCCRTNSCLADVAWSSSPHLSGEMPGRAAQRVKRPRTVAVAGVVHGELDIPLRRQGQELVFDLHLQCARPGHRARISRRGIAVFPSTTTRECPSSLLILDLHLQCGRPNCSWISKKNESTHHRDASSPTLWPALRDRTASCVIYGLLLLFMLGVRGRASCCCLWCAVRTPGARRPARVSNNMW